MKSNIEKTDMARNTKEREKEKFKKRKDTFDEINHE
jgi:hypothetical protein